MTFIKCREHCGACCIAPSITGPIPGMGSKPGGVRCIHLTPDLRCDLFGSPLRPSVCRGFRAETCVCGSSQAEALKILSELEGLDTVARP